MIQRNVVNMNCLGPQLALVLLRILCCEWDENLFTGAGGKKEVSVTCSSEVRSELNPDFRAT